MSPQQAALAYLKAGLPICLCNGGEGDEGKKPFGTEGARDWQFHSDWTPALVKKAFAFREKIGAPPPNAGIRLGPIMPDGGGFIDVEFDGDLGEAELDMLGIDLEGRGVAWESARGRHHLFRLTAEEFVKCEQTTRSGVLKKGDLEVRVGNSTGSLQSVLPNDNNGRAWVTNPPANEQDVSGLPPGALAKFLAALSTQSPVAEASFAERFDKKPGDYFNEREEWHDLLTDAGWSFAESNSGVEYWTRPGKSGGVSATLNYCSTDHRGPLFYSFSDAPEIEPLEANRTYSKFEFYVAQQYGDPADPGNFHTATRDVAERYPETKRSSPPVRADVVDDYDPGDYESSSEEPQEPDDLTLDLPLELIKFPGMVTDFSNWHANRTEKRYEYAGAVAGILLQSWIMGQRVRVGRNCPNLNVILLGDSGTGKTTATESIKEVLTYLNQIHLFATRFSSGEAIEDRMSADSHLFLAWEEVQGIFRGMGDNRRPHAQSLVAALNTIATSANTSMCVRDKATRGQKKPADPNLMNKEIQQPHLTAVYTGIENVIWPALPNEAGYDGFLGRMLVFDLPSVTTLADCHDDLSLRDQILEHSKAWLSIKAPQREAEAAVDTIASMGRELIDIPYTPDAAERLMEYRRKNVQTVYRLNTAKDHIGSATWSREDEMAAKLQLVMAGSLALPPDCHITAEQVDRSYEIVRRMFTYKVARIRSMLAAGTDLDRMVVDRADAALKWIRDRGGFTRRYELNKGPWRGLSARSREEAMVQLLSEEEAVLIRMRVGESTKTTEFIVLAGEKIPEKFEGKPLTPIKS